MSSQSPLSEIQWYLIHTNPKQEDRAAGNLLAWGIETLNPKLREVRTNPYTGSVSLAAKPMFPGYIFARFVFQDLFHKLRFTRGVQDVVCFGSEPALVDEGIIEMVRSRMDKTGFITMSEDIKPGDKVVVKEGPLEGFTGVFERHMKGSDRVVILLNTIGYQAHYEIEVDLLKRVNKEGPQKTSPC